MGVYSITKKLKEMHLLQGIKFEVDIDARVENVMRGFDEWYDERGGKDKISNAERVKIVNLIRSGVVESVEWKMDVETVEDVNKVNQVSDYNWTLKFTFINEINY